ncbi:metalloregulator ArsR/SmtB family transcription factor [Actinoplanes sp. NPDC024001]|uniref:ArsR/SmtB family transcription factor n=1 Tax=Actinoplanes sp. NPDC024001 TaxID=3154598 RepID=UPI0033C5EAA2
MSHTTPMVSFNHRVETRVSMPADTLTRVFSALADPTRRDMVARLAEGDATVNQLAQPYRMSLQAVYKHLKVLEEAGVVSRPPGPQPRLVRLETEVFDEMDAWIERYRRRAEERFRRLDTLLATMDDKKKKKGNGHEQDR